MKLKELKKKPNIITEVTKKKQEPVYHRSPTFEEAFANSTDRLTLKRTAALLKVSKSTMRRLVADNKIFHYKIDRHYLIPTKAMEAYTKSNGKASWKEQAENVGEHETRIINMDILSLPREKYEDSTISDNCIECKATCWHCKTTEDCIKTFPEDYKAYCYVCALNFEDNAKS